MNKKLISDYIVKYILALYANSSYPRKIVQELIEYMDELICNVLSSLKKDLIIMLQKSNVEIDAIDLESCFNQYYSIFDEFSTESKRFAFLKKEGLFDPEPFAIGEYLDKKLVGNEILYVPQSTFGVKVSLQKSLKLFLEIPGLFQVITNYMQELNKEHILISNIIQGDMWLKKYASGIKDEVVFPLYYFYDELEVGNPLGSHAGKNKFGAGYVSIASLPPFLSSQLNSHLN